MFPATIIKECIWKEYLSTQEASLPHLPDVEDLSPSVIRIMGDNPGNMQLQGTCTYLVGTGKSRILVDTGQGIPTWTTTLLSLLSTRSLTISAILLTHWHGDHTGGIPCLLPYLSSPPKIYKSHPDPNQHAIHFSQNFATEGATLRAIPTPGHSHDHTCFLLEEENALFTGDMVLGHGFSVAEDLGAYVRSLEMMRRLGCKVGYPGHGARIDDLPGSLGQYIRHRRGRERVVLGALKRSAGKGRGMTIKEVVEGIYGVVGEEVEMAVGPFVGAVLGMLAEEGKVGFVVDRGGRLWFASERMA